MNFKKLFAMILATATLALLASVSNSFRSSPSNVLAHQPIYRELMGKHFPTMAVVQVGGLVEPEARLEIEATAVIP